MREKEGERKEENIFEVKFTDDEDVRSFFCLFCVCVCFCCVLFLIRSFGTKKQRGEGRSILFLFLSSSSESVLLNAKY